MKRNLKNQTAQMRNTSTINIYINFLKRIAVDSWRFNGLPFDDAFIYRRVNNILNDNFINGIVSGLWFSKEGFFNVGKCVGNDRVTWYGDATKYQCSTFISTVNRDISEVALLSPSISQYTNFETCSISEIIWHYANLLYNCDAAIDVNLKGQNTPAIVAAPAGQELTWANIYEQVAGHKAAVFPRADVLLDEGTNDIRKIIYQDPAPYVSNNIEQLKSMLISDFIFILGINNRTQAKSAQITAPEIMQDNPTLMILRNSYQQAREDFCKQCADKFGLEVTTEIQDMPVGNIGMLVDMTKQNIEGGSQYDNASGN